ncbi:MAG: thiolase family protein, partial [Acidimicrobiaceae bacterium]|nr:thiolase family protein [Acidimicrobiaceae bacterium]
MAVRISLDSVWVLGAHMTRFARYPDRDLIDLASESALGALADGEVTVADIDVLACGA